MSPSHFWSLPGPQNFISRIRKDLHDGKSLILRMPRPGVSGIAEAVRGLLREEEIFCGIDLPIDGETPYERLSRVLCPGESRNLSLLELVTSACSLEKKVVVLKDISEGGWREWEKLMKLFSHRMRQISQAKQRVSLILPLVGTGFRTDFCDDIVLGAREWNGVISHVDSCCLAHMFLPERREKPELRQLLIQTIASLAMWDCDLHRRFAMCSPETILEPFSVLSAYALERGWGPDSKEDLWDGSCGLYEGKMRRHSAFLLVQDGPQAIERILWRAQVGVFLPYVADCCRDIVESKPMQNRLCAEANEEIEVAELFYILKKDYRTPSNLKEQVEFLRFIRNELAHMKRISYKSLARHFT